MIASIANNRRFIPVVATAVLFLIAYSIGAGFYQGMRDPQVFLNLFRTSPFLLIAAIGGTFVILTGGIDLSVSGVVALTTVAASALIRAGWDPVDRDSCSCCCMGMTLGTILGSLHYLYEGAAIYCHPGRIVVCPRHVFLYQR